MGSKIYTVAEIAKKTGYTSVRIWQRIVREDIPHERHGVLFIVKEKDYKKHFSKKPKKASNKKQ